MSGNDGMRGYLIQTIISLLEGLMDNNNWSTMTIEPLTESQKVDVVWVYPNGNKKIAQIKSSINDFTFGTVEKWAKELEKSQDSVYQLILVGTSEVDVRRISDNKMSKVDLIFKPLDIELLTNVASQKLNEYLTDKGLDTRPKIAKFIVESLTTKLEKYSTKGTPVSRENFDEIITDWYQEIVKQEVSNPRKKYVHLSATTSKDEIDKADKILKLINWVKCPGKKFECVNESKHQDEDDDLTEHHFDFIFKNQSKLVDNTNDISLITVVKTENYQSGNKFKRELNSLILDLSQSTECAIDSGHLTFNKEDNQTNIANILFWLNSDTNKEFTNEIPHIYDKIEYKHLINNVVFFVVDESRLNFIKNAISTAKFLKPECPVKFLYPLTEHNSQLNKISSRDFHFPYQFFNATILPIIMENKNESSVFIFCYDNYNKLELKRIVWLTFMITAGFANEYKIFFPDFDEKNDKDEAEEIINTFKDEIFKSRVEVQKYQDFPDEILNEKGSFLTRTKHDGYEHNTDKPLSLGAELIDTLIYGDKLQSVLNSSTLSVSDLKLLLAQRGILAKTSDKIELLPFIANLLFSPREIDLLKKLMVDKEKRFKDVPISPVEWKSTERLKPVYNTVKPDFTEIEKKYNFISPLSVSFKSDNEFEIEFKTKKENRLEGLYEGTSFPGGKVSCKLNDRYLDIDYSYQDTEPAKACREIIKEIQSAFKAHYVIESEAKAIMFSDFDETNSLRVDFLMSFEIFPNSTLFQECNTVNIKLRPDNDKKLPADLEKMRGKVKQLNIDGNNLKDLDFVYKQEYKECILLERVKIKYKFKLLNLENQYCIVDYGFSNALSSKINDGKFQTSFQFLMSEELKKVTNFQSVERTLKQEVKKLVMEKYNLYKHIFEKKESKEDALNEMID